MQSRSPQRMAKTASSPEQRTTRPGKTPRRDPRNSEATAAAAANAWKFAAAANEACVAAARAVGTQEAPPAEGAESLFQTTDFPTLGGATRTPRSKSRSRMPRRHGNSASASTPNFWAGATTAARDLNSMPKLGVSEPDLQQQTVDASQKIGGRLGPRSATVKTVNIAQQLESSPVSTKLESSPGLGSSPCVRSSSDKTVSLVTATVAAAAAGLKSRQAQSPQRPHLESKTNYPEPVSLASNLGITEGMPCGLPVGLQRARRVSAPARPASMPPTRAPSAPPGKFGKDDEGSFRSAAMMAADAANAHVQMQTLTQGLLSIAQQAASVGPDPALIGSFVDLHAKTTKLVQELQQKKLQPAGTDPAALLAFNLTVGAMSRGCILGHTQEKTLASIAENTRPRARQLSPGAMSPFRTCNLSVSNAGIPTPCVLPVAAAPGPIPKWALPSFHAPTDNWNSTEWAQTGTKTAAQIRRHSVGQRRQKKTKYSVVNPRTGERLVITSVVPFSWRHARRLRITDPKTGEEVLPLKPCSEDQEDDHSVTMPRMSTSSSTSRAESATPARRMKRMSIAGGAVKEGSTWALEPAAGGYWDWPLSRQEKKDRVLLLTQLELLSEIEELQAEASTSKGD